MLVTRMQKKMIDFYEGSIRDIEHFLKVLSYASLIGRMEGVDEKTQGLIEMAAIVHDISIPYCRKKYGSANGKYQEKESEAILRPFLAEFELEQDVLERIIYLISHHHTTDNIDGIDYQILIEADFLVNAAHDNMPKENIRIFLDKVVKTASGKALIESVFLR
ncbi:MAG: HD domain-containing protein [Clostridia bacterium]|nr:HD domain-containing protein [Clostridia bacterium]